MKRILTRKLVPGMVLANDVHTYNSSLKLLDKGTVLEDKDIARLAFYSIIDVLIEDAERVRVCEHQSRRVRARCRAKGG